MFSDYVWVVFNNIILAVQASMGHNNYIFYYILQIAGDTGSEDPGSKTKATVQQHVNHSDDIFGRRQGRVTACPGEPSKSLETVHSVYNASQLSPCQQRGCFDQLKGP